MIEEISQYLVREFNLERVPCSIPKSEFEYFKTNLYFNIDSIFKILKKDKTQYPIYHFFNKIFSVKFAEKRPDGSEYFYQRINGRIKNEFELIPDPKNNSLVYPVFTFAHMSNRNNFVEIRYGDDYEKKIYSVLQSVYEFKYYFREKSLNNLLSL